ncbi:flagellar hook-length control protein FliK [Phenylobacterium sp.]|uniref:flagellar hook-length control protein FliK n=1 Tax=Phenylobacterium sp. TaxID=1871053 RepID=UPI002723D8E0|nr:flagellar hook-length control protein FliK [Phenylobacterium sp.]MDO8801507.1 flagellar hook-length control protein FliK [Phenylobacterium sp.]
MTAPLLNASTFQPAAAGAAPGLFGAGAAAGQSPMAGFEALLTAFFGGQGAAEPLLGPDGKPVLKTPGAAKDAKASMADKEEAEATDTATPSTDAQILAALLAQPIAPPAAVVPTTAGDTAEGETPAGAPASPAFAPLVPDATLAQAAQAMKVSDARTATAAGAVVQAATDAAVEASDADGAGEPAPLADTSTPSPLLEGKPAAARPSSAAGAAPTAAEVAAPRPVAPPPAAAAAAPPPPPAAPAPRAQAAEISAVAEAVVAAEAVETPEAGAAPETPAAPPRAKTAARAARNEAGPRTETAATPTVADADPLGASVVAQAETAETFDSGAEGKREAAAPAVEAKADTDTGQPVAPNVGDAAATASTSAPAEARPGPQTVAHLAAQIVKKLEGRSTQFDVALNPEGLGRVDVRIEIGAQGKLTASMAFENPLAASELRARAGELQKALEQAGFDISGGIRFDVAADRGQGQAGQGQFGHDPSNNGGASRGRAFQAALDSADQTADAALSGALNLQRRTLMSGVDVRI